MGWGCSLDDLDEPLGQIGIAQRDLRDPVNGVYDQLSFFLPDSAADPDQALAPGLGLYQSLGDALGGFKGR